MSRKTNVKPAVRVGDQEVKLIEDRAGKTDEKKEKKNTRQLRESISDTTVFI